MTDEILLSPGKLIKEEEDQSLFRHLYHLNSVLTRTISNQIKGIRGAKSKELGLDEKTAAGLRIEKSASDQFIGAHAISMSGFGNKTDLTSLSFVKEKKRDFLICAKTDGVRYLLYLMTNGKLYFTDRKCQYFEVLIDIPPFYFDLKLKNTPELNFQIAYAFDGELIDFKTKAGKKQLHFLAFDTLMAKGTAIADKCYKVRLEHIREFENNMKFYKSFFPAERKVLVEKARERKVIKFYLKDFYATSQIKFLFKQIIEKKVLPHENDGLIFTRNSYPYLPGKNRGILKWKPQNLKTVDFFICENNWYSEQLSDLAEKDDFFIFELYGIFRGELRLFDFMFVTDFEQYLQIQEIIDDVVINGKTYNGCIYECNYDLEFFTEKFEYFYDFFYESDTESIEKFLKQSKYSKEDTEEEYVVETLMKCLEARLNNNQAIPKGGWKLLRDRKDKNYPNAYKTAISIFTTILEFNMTEDELIEQIGQPSKKLKN